LFLEPVYAVACHPKVPYLSASGGGNDKAYLWRNDTGDQLFELAGHTDSVTCVAFSADGQYVASGGMDGKINVWKVQDGQLVVTLDGPDEIEASHRVDGFTRRELTQYSDMRCAP
jgi:WD40 repeat protein